MIFTDTPIRDAVVIEPEPIADARGFFARSFCTREFEAHGLSPRVVQCSLALSKLKGTLRGLHFQRAPHAEARLVRCTAGALYDVVVDLRPQSPTFRRHFGIELSAHNRKMLYVPEGCAHGCQTLEDDTEVFYQMSEFFVPDAVAGVRWNDPAFDIAWPFAPLQISERDASYPDVSP